MKPIYLLAIILLLCPGSSCDEKNEPPPKTELEIIKEKIIGRWEALSPDYNRIAEFFPGDSLVIKHNGEKEFLFSYVVISPDTFKFVRNEIITLKKFQFLTNDTLFIEKFLWNGYWEYEDYILVRINL